MSDTVNDLGGGKMFYGWRIVIATFVIMLFGCGVAFYSFGVFIKPLAAEFGWSRTLISIAIGLWALMYGLSGPAVGILMHKFGARVVIAGCALLVGLCFVLLAWLNSLVMLFLLMFFAGIGSAGVTYVPNQTLISNWFEKYRGRAMGIMMIGMGVGGLIMPPSANAILTAFSWRTAFCVLGLLLMFTIIPVAILVVRTKPSDMGLELDGIKAEAMPDGNSKGSQSGLTVKRAVRTLSFWMLLVTSALQTLGVSALGIHFVACVDDAGLSSQTAANFWGLALGFSLVGRPLFGFLADRWNPRNLLTITLGGLGTAVAVLLVLFLYMGIPPMISLVLFGSIYGVSLGGFAVLLPVVIGRCFGLLNFSKILGLLMSAFAIGVIGGPLLAGRVFDVTGSYQVALLIFGSAFAVTVLTSMLIRPDGYKSEFVQV